MFAAVSDVDNTSLIDLLAVKKGQRIMCFDAVAAFGEANESELVFIEAPEEHKMVAGDLSSSLTYIMFATSPIT